MEKLVLKEIKWSSPEYFQELELRNEILRKPLGLNLYDQDLSVEKEYWRVGAFLDTKLIGVLLLVPLEEKAVQMKQMAVRKDLHGMGVGRKIICFAEDIIEQRGYKNIFLNARSNACSFYEKMGYEVIGDEFLEIGIPHYKMRKNI